MNSSSALENGNIPIGILGLSATTRGKETKMTRLYWTTMYKNHNFVLLWIFPEIFVLAWGGRLWKLWMQQSLRYWLCLMKNKQLARCDFFFQRNCPQVLQRTLGMWCFLLVIQGGWGYLIRNVAQMLYVYADCLIFCDLKTTLRIKLVRRTGYNFPPWV